MFGSIARFVLFRYEDSHSFVRPRQRTQRLTIGTNIAIRLETAEIADVLLAAVNYGSPI